MKRTQIGFGLIEVLIAMVVVAIGLLAVATFQAELMKESGSSKAKSEALAIAQSHLDQLRNYTDGVALLHYNNPVTSETEFNTVFANASAPFVDDNGNAIEISGTNAFFSPSYQISTSGPGKIIAVSVTWTGHDGASENVTLNTRIGWQSPSAVGDLASNASESLIPSPMGRAHLGEGTLSTDIVNAHTVTTSGDNTKTVDDGSGDLKLVVYDSNLDNQQVVLTLNNACISGVCTDFIKISGRVYIDKAAQAVTPGNLYIKASDAAYCHRYYTDSTGSVKNVTTSTTTIDTPDTRGNAYDNIGDYEYFDYTCYLGGGWHGNIGVIKGGGLGVHDLACLGDPTSTNLFEQPVITARRAYRAMVHKVDAGGVPITNANGMIIYYSTGIADARTFNNHDIVFTSLTGNPTNSDCFSANAPMTRADSTVDGVVGALFANMPDEFFCLNPVSADVDPTLYNFNDTANSGYALFNYCPYDPTNPPTALNTVSGTITIASSTPGKEAIIGTNLTINTSDAAGNCTYPVTFSYNAGPDTYTGAYTCNVYHKGAGWSGYITLDYTQANITDPNVTCTTSQINLVNVLTNISGQNFNTCATGANRIISGDIVVASTTTGLESDLASIVTIDASDSGQNCTKGAFTYSASAYTSAYECIVLDQGSGWSGTIDITTQQINDRNVSCTTSQRSYTNLVTDSNGQNFSTCTQTTISTINISGTATSTANNKILTSASVTPTGGVATACTVTTTTGDNRSYTCAITFTTESWSGTLTLNSSSGSVICHSGAGTTNTKTEPYLNVGPGNYTYNATIKGSSGSCPASD